MSAIATPSPADHASVIAALAEHDEIQAELAAGRAASRIVSDAAWALETAVSMERKARLGYRSNPKLGDAPWDGDEYTAKIAAARVNLARVLVVHRFPVNAG